MRICFLLSSILKSFAKKCKTKPILSLNDYFERKFSKMLFKLTYNRFALFLNELIFFKLFKKKSKL